MSWSEEEKHGGLLISFTAIYSLVFTFLYMIFFRFYRWILSLPSKVEWRRTIWRTLAFYGRFMVTLTWMNLDWCYGYTGWGNMDIFGWEKKGQRINGTRGTYIRTLGFFISRFCRSRCNHLQGYLLFTFCAYQASH